MKKKYIVSKKSVIYAQKYLVLITTIKKNHKVRDHCRYTGKYRGVARDICNSKCKTQKNFL